MSKERSFGICQECKRLKIRCSRTVPCDQCTRRGIEDICPDGKLTTGRAGRYVLTSAEKLHEENKTLKLRVRELENALEEMCKQHSQESHPLLEPRLLSIARPYLYQDTSKPSAEGPSLNQSGTIQLDKGKDRWLGATALSEVHFRIHDKDDDFEPAVEEHAKFAVPFSLMYPPHVLTSMALENLPPKEEAWSLLETYYEHGVRLGRLSSSVADQIEQVYAYQFNAREDFIKRVFAPAYSSDTSSITPYKLSSLYSILCLGALYDLSRPIYAQESREYMEIAQSLLMSAIGQWEVSMDSIEAVALLVCIFPSRPELELSKTYYQSSWALKMAQSIGLHKDPEELGINKETSHRRRRLFADLRLVDATESLLYGRPLTMSDRFVSAGSFTINDDESEITKFKNGIVSIMEEIADLFMGTGPSSYASTLKLDRKLRALRPQMKLHREEEGTGDDLDSLMHAIWYYSTLLTLHRTHFAFAATKVSSDDHQGGKLAPSVVSSYDASTALITAAIDFAQRHPGLLPRLGIVWPHIFTCMIVLYSFGVYMPLWTKTPDALKLAERCVNQVYSPSIECVRAKETLPYLLMLREKAHASTAAAYSKNPQSTEPISMPGLSAGIAVETSDTPVEDFRTRAMTERGVVYASKGARGMALRQAQAHLFGNPDQWFRHTSHIQKTCELGPEVNEDVPLEAEPNLAGDATLQEMMNWSWNPDDASVSFGSTPEQIPQLELQSSWADFLLNL